MVSCVPREFAARQMCANLPIENVAHVSVAHLERAAAVVHELAVQVGREGGSLSEGNQSFRLGELAQVTKLLQIITTTLFIN